MHPKLTHDNLHKDKGALAPILVDKSLSKLQFKSRVTVDAYMFLFVSVTAGCFTQVYSHRRVCIVMMAEGRLHPWPVPNLLMLFHITVTPNPSDLHVYGRHFPNMEKDSGFMPTSQLAVTVAGSMAGCT